MSLVSKGVHFVSCPPILPSKAASSHGVTHSEWPGGRPVPLAPEAALHDALVISVGHFLSRAYGLLDVALGYPPLTAVLPALALTPPVLRWHSVATLSFLYPPGSPQPADVPQSPPALRSHP